MFYSNSKTLTRKLLYNKQIQEPEHHVPNLSQFWTFSVFLEAIYKS
jgi:protein-tyrosine phosphatase